MTEISHTEYERVATLVEKDGLTLEEALERIRTGGTAATATKAPKYGNVRVEQDGIPFDSMAERRRYQELKLREQRGEIEDLTLQPVFTLHAPTPQGELRFIGRYTADFAYRVVATGEMVTEDVKGGDATKTQLYRWKRRHVELEYGLTITEVQ